MLIGGTSDLGTAMRLAESFSKPHFNVYVVKSAHVYDIVELPDALQLSKRLKVMEETNQKPVAVWVEGARTI